MLSKLERGGFIKYKMNKKTGEGVCEVSMRLLLCALLITSNAIACDYKSDDEIQYEGQIESVRVIDKKVYPYVDDTRICTMHIESRIEGEWYPSKGKYIFGSDMSEDDGLFSCRKSCKSQKSYIGTYTRNDKK